MPLRTCVGRILRSLAWALWPRTCLACEAAAVAAGGLGCCPACAASFWPNLGPRCAACDGARGQTRCGCALLGAGAFHTRCPWRHDGALACALSRSKAEGLPSFFAALGRAMAHDAGVRRLAAGACALVPIPSDDARLRARGLNPSTVLADALGAQLGLPVVECLRRPRGSPHQRGRNRLQRRSDPPRFVAANVPPGATLLLVDDVVTTGATLRAAAEALRASAGEARSIGALAAARR